MQGWERAINSCLERLLMFMNVYWIFADLLGQILSV